MNYDVEPHDMGGYRKSMPLLAAEHDARRRALRRNALTWIGLALALAVLFWVMT